MKTIHKDNRYYTQFSSSTDLYQQLIKPTLGGRYTDSQDKESDGDWSGTKTFNEAIKLFKGGDDKSYQMVKKLKAQGDRYLQDEYHNFHQRLNDVQGYSPNVPSAILGLPKSMHNQKLLNRQIIYRKIFFDRTANGSVSKDILAIKGAYALSYVDYLERVGKCRFELWVGTSSDSTHGSIIWGIKLKNYDELLNIYQLAFNLVNPAFLRRLDFKLDENMNDWPDVTDDGYGRSAEKSPEYITDWLGNKTIVISNQLNLSPESSVKDNFEEVKKAFNNIYK